MTLQRIVFAVLLALDGAACPIGPTGPMPTYLRYLPKPKVDVVWVQPKDWVWPTSAGVAAEWILWQGVERAGDVMVKPR